MSMNKLLLAGVAGTFLAGSAAMAAEPVKLTDAQMDDVTAGFLRLTLGARLGAVDVAARLGQTVTTSDRFRASTVDEQSINDSINVSNGGETVLFNASSRLASRVNAGSRTTATQVGGSSLLVFNATVVGTVDVAPPLPNGPL